MEEQGDLGAVQASTIAPLRIADFRRLWIALAVFNSGHLILVVASSWLMLELTSSPLWVSLMVAAPILPLLFLSLPAGAAADLLDRKAVLVGSSALLSMASLAMGALSLLDLVTPGRLVALGLAVGIGIAFFHPSWQAMVPSLVPSSLVPGAVSLNSATGGLATAIGPAAGGFLVATAGFGWSFIVAAAGYAALLFAALLFTPTELKQERASVAIAIATGIRYLRFSQNYLWLLLLGGLFGFASAALRAMLPNLTSDVLQGNSALYGLLLALFGAGALVGGVTRQIAARGFGAKLVPACIVLFGAANALAGMSQALLLTAAAVFVAGLLWTWILSTLSSIYQMLTPDWVRGRAMSAFVLSVFGFMPLGSIAAGWLGEAIGAANSLVAFSVLVVAIGSAAFRMPLPVLERIEPPVVPVREPDPPSLARERSEAVMVVNTWTVSESDFDRFLAFLSELRRLRLRTGAYDWTAYRSASNLNRISEVFLLHSWEQHLQQHRRLDLEDLRTIERMATYGAPDSLIRDHLVSLDVDNPARRPEWQDLVAEHEQMHRPHMDEVENG